MMNKKRIIIIAFMIILLLSGCNKKIDIQETKSISIVIIDGNNEELYNQNINTNKEKLLDVLEDINVDLKYKDDKYGAYITSLMGLSEETTKNGMHYWSYYIDDKYAETGISDCNVETGKTYKFVYEYYEY